MADPSILVQLLVAAGFVVVLAQHEIKKILPGISVLSKYYINTLSNSYSPCLQNFDADFIAHRTHGKKCSSYVPTVASLAAHSLMGHCPPLLDSGCVLTWP